MIRCPQAIFALHVRPHSTSRGLRQRQREAVILLLRVPHHLRRLRRHVRRRRLAARPLLHLVHVVHRLAPHRLGALQLGAVLLQVALHVAQAEPIHAHVLEDRGRRGLVGAAQPLDAVQKLVVQVVGPAQPRPERRRLREQASKVLHAILRPIPLRRLLLRRRLVLLMLLLLLRGTKRHHGRHAAHPKLARRRLPAAAIPAGQKRVAAMHQQLRGGGAGRREA
mmetsp:Transcript_37732/g.96545  ORF Transcript_37732/g.96545 Transcript_37732/m.96545 type:complete len:223 (-) Transcript_37732:398-1066(-)